MRESPMPGWKPRVEMFGLSFTALFLEMMVIRWAPSVVHLVAYYANLMLLSSFLGMGVGALASERRWKLIGWFPLLVALDAAVLLGSRNAVLGTSSSEAHFFALSPSMFDTALLVGIFAANALVFVPIGERMGILFRTLPSLSAYAWDLAGSLCGTLSFGLFSLERFSPVLGLAVVMAVWLVLSRSRLWLLQAAINAATLAAIAHFSDPHAVWSPYYYITVNRLESPGVTESAPPAGLTTMRDPPAYMVKVNQFGYHLDAALNPARYTPGTERYDLFRWLHAQYGVPYALAQGRDRVLVVGAGGGADVEAALDYGVRQVDAVEIDPAVIVLSHRFNAGAPYADPRVRVHIDDARSYLARAKPGYDLVVFGFLDSQALFSTMNNVRLDGYVYTKESLRTAFGLLGEHGVLSLSFFLGRPWLGPKLYQLVAEATGTKPALYLDSTSRTLILCVAKSPQASFPDQVNQFRRAAYTNAARYDLPTDDWPFLYLIKRTVPSDYAVAIGALLLVSVSAVAWLRRGAFGRPDLHFGFLGMGFLLLETKSIGDSTLYFGATWLVTTLVVSGVLLMVIGANLAAMRLRAFSPWLYAPLLGSLALLILVPRESILGLDFGSRLAWTLLVVPLPIFFAGLVFSTTFRNAPAPSAAFGANLVGAMIGGFCEYLGMAVGSRGLSLLVIAVYLASFLTLRAGRPGTRPALG